MIVIEIYLHIYFYSNQNWKGLYLQYETISYYDLDEIVKCEMKCNWGHLNQKYPANELNNYLTYLIKSSKIVIIGFKFFFFFYKLFIS